VIRFDEIGAWSEVKLEILRKYASAYSRILASQRSPSLEHYYIDGFSGAGLHLSKKTGQVIEGSPTIALHIDPPFRRFFFVDLDGDKVQFLHEQVGIRPDVEILRGDSNSVLLQQVFPQVAWEQYRRALCLLDPYGLQLDWEVIREAGQRKTIDLFLNFPVMDMNRNALWREPEKAWPELAQRMTRFWGDGSWRDAIYQRSRQLGLFGDDEAWIKATNEEVAEAFRQRLKQVAGFPHVPRPLPMKNSKNAVVYYLFFASQKPAGEDIVEDLFDKYR
jgi:three-Cys-motif partner protein